LVRFFVHFIGVREVDILSFKLALEESVFRIARAVYMAECYANSATSYGSVVADDDKKIEHINASFGDASNLMQFAETLLSSGTIECIYVTIFYFIQYIFYLH
jgi:hypothetical protein